MKSHDVRQIATRMRSLGCSLGHICTVLQVHRTTVWRWTQHKRPADVMGRPRKLNEHEEMYCCAFVAAHPTTTLHDIVFEIAQHFKKIVSISLVHRTLERSKITVKKATKRFDQQKPSTVLSFLESLPPEASQSWLTLDECGFLMNHVRPYARSLRGTRAVVSRPGPRGTRYSLLLCIAPTGVACSEFKEKGFLSRHFQSFMQSAVPGNCTLLADNCSIHKATKSLMKLGLPTIPQTAATRCIDMKYLPSYCPQLNPVELCFNVIKAHVNRAMPRTGVALKAVVHDAIKRITPEQCQRFYDHCWSSKSQTWIARESVP